MSDTTIGIIGLCILVVLFLIQMPVAFAMLLVGLIGLFVVKGVEPGLSSLSYLSVRWSSDYLLSAIPLFLLMGFLAARTGLIRDAFYVANKWIGHTRGGLAVSVIGGSAIFGTVCGDVVAAAAAMCTVALPEMRRYEYKDSLSLGCIAAGGTLSFLIPPSIGFVVYAIIVEMSIGKLFIAGIMPGIMLSVLFAITIWVQCKIDPSLASLGPKATWKDRFVSIRHVWGFVVLIFLVLGGIYGGVFTPTEAGAIGVFGTVILGLIKRELKWQGISDSFRSAAVLSGMIFIMIIASQVLNTFIALTEISQGLANYVAQLDVPPHLILVITLIILIISGFFVSVLAVIVLMMPILHPILMSLGFDPLLLGVLATITVVMGHLSPPFGLLVFAIAGVVKDVPLFTIFRGAMPFFIVLMVGVGILIAFPEITLFLPNLMK